MILLLNLTFISRNIGYNIHLLNIRIFVSQHKWLGLAFANLSRCYVTSVPHTVADNWDLISAVDNGK